MTISPVAATFALFMVTLDAAKKRCVMEIWRQLYPMSFAIGLIFAMFPILTIVALIGLWAWIVGRLIWCLITGNPLATENEPWVEQNRC